MQLDEYIKETLVQITKGVKDASEVITDMGGTVNPAKEHQIVGSDPFHSNADAQIIKFDVAIQVKDISSQEASGKAKLSVLSFGGGLTNTDETQAVHRVQFDVPLALPCNVPSSNNEK
ncbi:hypothetical protein V4D06_19950 [Vibrio mimicus]|uniref:hypothetical protein n=1 Tax=Vibrio mimicus TaxID=674 RepID=UPI002F938174